MSMFSCVLIGDESLTQACGERLLQGGHDIRAVVSADDAVRVWAEAQGLSVFSSPDALHGVACDRGFDWILSVANLRVLQADILDLARQGAVNFHDGPLPRYAGLNTPVWAILNDEAQHGITWHLMESGIDTGDVLVSRMFEIETGDTAHSLNTKAYAAGIESFADVMRALETGDTKGRAQGGGTRIYCGRDDRPAGFGLLDPGRSVEDILRLVRALDFAGYANPLCAPKLDLGVCVALVGGGEAVNADGTPGAILSLEADALTLAVGDGAVRLTGLRDMFGDPFDPGAVMREGDILPLLTGERVTAINETMAGVNQREPYWRSVLKGLEPVSAPLATRHGAAPNWTEVEIAKPAEMPADTARAVAALWALVSSGQVEADIAWQGDALAKTVDAAHGLLSPWVPLRVSRDVDDWDELLAAISNRIDQVDKARGFAADIFARDPALRELGKPQVGLSGKASPVPGMAISLALNDKGLCLFADLARLETDAVERLKARLETMLKRVAVGVRDIDRICDLPDSERRALLSAWNATESPHDRSQTVHGAFEKMAAQRPDETALIFEDRELSYATLDAEANSVAASLRDAGVARGDFVALCVPRGPDMVIGALAILKAGAAYLPLDPTYPQDRLLHCIADSGAGIVLSRSEVTTLPECDAARIDMDGMTRSTSVERVDGGARPGDLAYLIYTSGSTGRPKGVMVEHGNVVNFFHGMDTHVDADLGRVWMAVTSLAFDISVLELFYTLARGFSVVISGDETRAAISNGPVRAAPGGAMDFSLYYWGADDVAGPGKYDLLLEGAKYADENGFAAIWTPERHFHAFGGPYPNPSVTGASVAGMTRNIGVRAGSIVAPLHHPARIAEEWAVIDNLTNGRAGLAFASGWQPDDFVLRPENTPPKNRDALFDTLNKARALWRGEPVEFARENRDMHPVVTQPRPVSPELEAWVTTAGNPATWREAGENGAHILTHLLGQSVEEVAEKIGIYHDALRKAGHDPAKYKVTLMLHAYLAETREAARDVARGPMKDYLRSAAGLIKQYAWAFPAFKKPKGVTNPFEIDLSGLSDEEMEGILDFAFERYFEDSGFFGTVEDGIARAEQLRAIGVSEIACLIEYGIDKDTVLDSLPRIKSVMDHVNSGIAPAEDDFSLAAQIVRHGVTHLQATPSMAQLFVMNDEARGALSGVKQILLGGEALPGSLVTELRKSAEARILNMYGPTETTIWSSVAEPGASAPGAEPIGRPIVNTVMRVLDEDGALCPIGVPGELWIGGEGVSRGYWRRDDLSAERFKPDPVSPEGGRLYRTGDLVRWRADGQLDFLGRMDFQVKIRGQRIELGEIETAMKSDPAIAEAVAVARDMAGDTRLVGYYTASGDVDETALRAHMALRLTGAMVPAHLMRVDAFPLTPNKKIDRKALPDPAPRAGGRPKVEEPSTEPSETGVEAGVAAQNAQEITAIIAQIWQEVLGIPDVGGRDNFFDLGGHSLLAVQAHRSIRAHLADHKLSITDVFRYPVLDDLAAHLAAQGVRAARAPEPQAPVREERATARPADPRRPVLSAETARLVLRRRALRQERGRERA